MAQRSWKLATHAGTGGAGAGAYLQCRGETTTEILTRHAFLCLASTYSAYEAIKESGDGITLRSLYRRLTLCSTKNMRLQGRRCMATDVASREEV